MNFRLTAGMRKIGTAILLCLGVAFLSADFSIQETPLLQEGDIATQDIVAIESFEYLDIDETERQKQELREKPYSVYQLDVSSSTNIQYRVGSAFREARTQVQNVSEIDQSSEESVSKHNAELQEIQRGFLEQINLELDGSTKSKLVEQAWSIEIEQVTQRLIDESMQAYIIDSSVRIPREGASFNVVRLFVDQQDQITLNENRNIKTLAEAQQFVSVLAGNINGMSNDHLQVGTNLARAAIQVNFIYDYSRTKQFTERNIAAVESITRTITKGLSLVRKGDQVSARQAKLLVAMHSTSEMALGFWGSFFTILVLSAFAAVSLYHFASSFVRRFATGVSSLETMATLILVTVLLGRLLQEGSSYLQEFGFGEHVLWYATPVAAGSMVIRILMNSETALVWVICVSLFLGISMDQNVLFCLYFIVSGVIASASLAHTKDRLNILRAGFQTGLINAALALMIEVSMSQLAGGAEYQQPLCEILAAISGGILASFLALGVIPLFEAMGFVTDYKLLELGNLNHPLLRQLFLRAPGTYHHSMTMAQLSEAAAESIGANALQAKVACYYHDIGKSLQPQFFIENQRGTNPHDALEPHQSARVIMTHVVDGYALGQQHGLPQPILDAIIMHHGTGLIKYFYIKALELVDSPEEIDERNYRYNGKRPDSKEMGIIFLADRVEAACRTLKEPRFDDFREMIQTLVNSALTDGQLEECPLTIKELYIIMDVFAKTMTGIYHHRIEYPSLPQALQRQKKTGITSVITLETQNPFAHEPTGYQKEQEDGN